MAIPVSDSAGTMVVLRENRGATLWRRLTNTDVPDLIGYVPFFTLNPRGPAPVAIECTVTDNYFEFYVETAALKDRTEYRCGWVDPADNTQVLFYGELILV